MSNEPEDVVLARETLERKTGPQSHPIAQQLARAVITWWESSDFWRSQAGALGPALLRANEAYLRANEELSRRQQSTFPPPHNVSCVKCHVGVGQQCKFTETELEDMPADFWRDQAGAGAIGMVHRERANQLGVDLKPRHCASCGNPSDNHPYRHPFVTWAPGMPPPHTPRCGAWSYPGHESWEGAKLKEPGGRQCALLAGHVGDHDRGA